MPKVGRFGPPPSLPFGSVRGGRVRSVWSRPAFGPHPFLGTVSCGLVPGSVAPWSPLAGSSTGCCGTASVSRVRSCAQLTRFSASLATYRSRLAQVSNRWRAPVAKLAPGGALAAPPFLVRRAHPRHSALPFPFGGPASRTLSASPGVAGAPPRFAGCALRRSGRGCVSFVQSASRSGVGIWLRTLGAFVAPRVV